MPGHQKIYFGEKDSEIINLFGQIAYYFIFLIIIHSHFCLILQKFVKFKELNSFGMFVTLKNINISKC